jgi:hypothetical protein
MVLPYHVIPFGALVVALFSLEPGDMIRLSNSTVCLGIAKIKISTVSSAA